MKTYKIIEEMSNSSRILCKCGDTHNVKNSKLSNFICSKMKNFTLDTQEFKMYEDYRKRALRKGREFTLDDLQFKQLIYSDCFYCGEPPEFKKTYKRNFNTIDRVNNNTGYVPHNTVSCCNICNIMKRTMSIEEYINRCKRVVNDNEHYKELQKKKDRYGLLAFQVKRGSWGSSTILYELIRSSKIKFEDIKYDIFESIKREKFEEDSHLVINLTHKGKSMGTKTIKQNTRELITKLFKALKG